MKLVSHGAVLTFVVAAALAVSGQTDEQWQIESRLKADFQDKSFLLRHFYQGGRLTYTMRGEPLEGGRPGIWTVDGKIKVRKLSWVDRTVELEGERLALVYDDSKHEFEDQRGKRRIRVILQAPPGVSEAVIREGLDRIFLRGLEPSPDMVPAHWAVFLATPKNKRRDLRGWKPDYGDEVFVGGSTTSKGGKVLAPRISSAPDPDYDKEARNAKLQGTVVLSVVVTRDGATDRILVKKPLGMGLDEAAVEAVSRWKFSPATKDGRPLAVHINVEVNFRLY